MTRISAAAVISIGLSFCPSLPAAAQSDPDTQCFPWQEYRAGRCVAKPSEPPPIPEPSPAPAAIEACDQGTRSLSGQCVCPINTHLELSGHCVADAAPIPPPSPPLVSPATTKSGDNVVCDGGRVAGGQCLCPAGFKVVATSATSNGGMCVKTNAENCLGGELTVSGACLCNGQVVMSGETYLLEYTNGKCVPKRCPVQTQWRDGKCVALSAVSPAPEPPPNAKPAPSKETPKATADDEDDRRPHCGRGMIRTRNGCMAARHKLPNIGPQPSLGALPGLAGPAPNLGNYYRTYQNQGNSLMRPN